MSDETPILRADALDEEDLVDPVVPKFAEGGIITHTDSGADTIPAFLSNGCQLECYENSEGGWSYRQVR